MTDVPPRSATPEPRRVFMRHRVLFPPEWTGLKGFLWRLVPLRWRSEWSPYDNWLRGYDDGWRAAHRYLLGKEPTDD